MHPHLSQCAPSLWSPQTVSVLPLTISLSPRLPHCYSHCFMPHNCLVFHLADFRSSPAASMSSLCHSFPQETASVFPYHPCLMPPPNSVDPGCLGVHQGYLNVPKAASLFAYQLNPHPTSCHHVPPPVPQCLPWHLTQGPPTALASPQLPQCSSGCLNFVKPHFLDIFPWCFVVSFLVASLSQCLPCRQQYINKWGEAECRGLLMGL